MTLQFLEKQFMHSQLLFITTLNDEHLEDMIYLKRIIDRCKKSCLRQQATK